MVALFTQLFNFSGWPTKFVLGAWHGVTFLYYYVNFNIYMKKSILVLFIF